MNYTQLKNPNLSVEGVSGECLVYVRKMYGINAMYLTAIAGWNGAKYKHPGETPPTNVDVPLWFTYGTEGHVALNVPGKGIFSVSAQGDKVFASIAALEDYIKGATYLGWSEDIDGVRVVEQVAVLAANTITLPASSGTWHLYKNGGPYNPNVAADVKGILNPAKFGGLTYSINASLGNGVYRVTTQDFGQGDLWTNGSQVTIK